jgi:alanine racemase
MCDVTDRKEVKVGDPVTLIGEQGRERITASELADLCDTISYEVLTGISSRVPRVGDG